MENSNFIKKIVEEDLLNKKHDTIITRFPPEPNGYLHIGHARAITTNFTLASEFNGIVNLRFDDTNPIKEDTTYVEAIKKDIEWLGFKWNNVFYASDYFDTMYEKAEVLIKKGLAYVCSLTAKELNEHRGTLTETGMESPYRNTDVDTNLNLFREMKDGKYLDGSKVLRAKIDMDSPNMNLRDPVIYRIQRAHHHNTGDKWCIYPMYDYAHPLEDAIEGITHSLCGLEFEDHRPLYDWFVKNCDMKYTPRQIEFGNLNVSNAVLSKRYIKQLVDMNIVSGWDDPRLLTISGMRRRGITSDSIVNFVLALGLPKSEGTTDYQMFEGYIRDDLALKTKRVNAILNPLKVIITNYPEGKNELLTCLNNNQNEELGEREISFSREVYIEKEDFILEKPNKKWKRLALGIEVRLMHAYFIKANDVIYNDAGDITEVHCTYDVNTKSGSGFSERKPNGNIHWVDASNCKKAKINLFESLILDSDFDSSNFIDRVNPDSKTTIDGFVENNVDYSIGTKFQFIRNGYFSVDYDSTEENLLFNRIVGLRSSFKKK